MYFPFIWSHLRVVIYLIFTELRLFFSKFIHVIFAGILAVIFPVKFSIPRTRSLNELTINFKITLLSPRRGMGERADARASERADECYYRYRAIIRILLRCLMQYRVTGFAKKFASGIKREQSLVLNCFQIACRRIAYPFSISRAPNCSRDARGSAIPNKRSI